MGLSNLFTVGADSWDTFWFNNWLDHWAIQEAILKQKNIQTVLYQIQPWDPNDIPGILERHQQFHNEMNKAVGQNQQGVDLTEIDFSKASAIEAWVDDHYQEHLAMRAVLTLGI